MASESSLGLAQDAAVQYWGAPPCQGGVTILYAPSNEMPATNPPIPTGNLLFATASMLTTSTANVWSSCVITLNGDYVAPTQQDSNFPFFCGLVVHEYGHFFGHYDDPSEPPTSINNEEISDANEHVAPCVARYAPVPTPSTPVAIKVQSVPSLLVIGKERRSTRRASKTGRRETRSHRSATLKRRRQRPSRRPK